PDAAAGWDILRDKVLRGDNLNSHLSTRHASLSNRDGLLAEWNVHHLHLGTNSHHANPFYVSRTHRLVFALIDNRTFHAIGVYEHGHWEETSIIERIHRNWPDAVSSHRMRGVTGANLTREQRRALRGKNVKFPRPLPTARFICRSVVQ